MTNKRRGARIAILSLAILAATARCRAGPFGFERAMTKEQVMKLLGAGSLIKAEANVYTFSKAPKPHPLFEEYILIISPTEGLLKVVAISKDIVTSVYGEELKGSFEEIRGALTKTYGEGKTYDFLKDDSIWNEPKDWMMGMLKKERTLDAFWTLSTPKDHLTIIHLETKALSREKGYLALGYEFEGYDAYADAQKEKRESVF